MMRCEVKKPAFSYAPGASTELEGLRSGNQEPGSTNERHNNHDILNQVLMVK